MLKLAALAGRVANCLVAEAKRAYMACMAGEIMDNRGRGEAAWRWPSIHAEGRKFGLISGVLCVVA
ncbi:MAG: hypothetical protein AB7U34_11395, partial [Novosphingobium sp.]